MTRLILGILVLGLALLPEAAVAQSGGGSLRPYWHIFLAYASAWVILGAWVASVARRISRLEQDADRGGP